MSNSQSGYGRFIAMIVTSTVIMYGLMYLNTYVLDHVHFSETRLYMALYMGAVMAVVMLAFMWGMYKYKRLNWLILGGSTLLFVLSLWLVRSQATISDESRMNAMIPHHSIAILTSSRADIEDVRVRQLAEDIIRAQEREIAEMKWLLDDIEANGKALSQAEAAARPVPDIRD